MVRRCPTPRETSLCLADAFSVYFSTSSQDRKKKKKLFDTWGREGLKGALMASWLKVSAANIERLSVGVIKMCTNSSLIRTGR